MFGLFRNNFNMPVKKMCCLTLFYLHARIKAYATKYGSSPFMVFFPFLVCVFYFTFYFFKTVSIVVFFFNFIQIDSKTCKPQQVEPSFSFT